MHANMIGMKKLAALAAIGLPLCFGSLPAALGGPNIMAIGDYHTVPFKRAPGRESFSGKEVVYSFPEPEFDFGRVVVRSTQPPSIVKRDLFVGFTGNDLRVSTRLGGQGSATVSVTEVEIWLKIKGQLRPNTTYEWETLAGVARDSGRQAIPAIIPAFWADGQPIGVDVTITDPVPEETDRERRMMYPRGRVKTPAFEKQTGAAWIVLKPRGFGEFYAINRFAFREVDTLAGTEAQATMPIPVRYVPIRNQVEDQIAEVLGRSSEVLRRSQAPEGFWSAGSEGEANINLTAFVTSALGETGAKDERVAAALKWMAGQKPPDRGSFGVAAVAGRLACLARFGEPNEYAAVIQGDATFLVEAQLEDGGWGPRSPKAPAPGDSVVLSDHDTSLAVLQALMEARFAGAEVESRAFRNAMRYWTDAQTVDGAFTSRLARYGTISQPTVAYTATGTAGLIISLDMASGFGAKKCSLYLGSKEQLKAIDAGLNWLNEAYDEDYRFLGSFVSNVDPYLEPERLLAVGQASGVSHFNEKDHFVESADALLNHYDPATLMFGIRGQAEGIGYQPGKFTEPPSPRRTAWALRILGAGNSPTVLQRVVAGDEGNGWSQYRGDMAHLVRYLGRSKGTVYNWRRTGLDRPMSELAEVPIMFLSVVGPAAWTEDQWLKLREYCLSGGTVVVDIADDAEAQRAPVLAAIAKAFSEYSLIDLPQDAGVFAINKDHKPIAGIKAIGNGFRQFLFVPPKSWSCAWHTFDVKGSEDSFLFMEDLLRYATDDTPPRSSFARSTYAVPAASSRSMKAAQVQVGSDVPAYPNLIDTMSRLMQANYRMRVDESKVSDADLIWVNITGPAPASAAVKQQLLEAIRGNKQVFADVVSGNPDWDESFRAALKTLDSGLTIEALRRNDPVFTGEIAGTQGFDVTNVEFRKALHDRFSNSGRCDLYGIYYNGRRIGIYSAHDISSGIGYHYFPGCRGILPEGARQVAMNIFLSVYGGRVSPESRAGGR